MKKRLLAFFMAGLMVTTAITGCGKKTDGGADNADGSALNVEKIGQESTDDSKPENEASKESTVIEEPKMGAAIVDHNIGCKVSGKDVASGCYSEIILSAQLADKYPKLQEFLKEDNENWERIVKDTVNEYAYYQIDSEYPVDEPYESSLKASILRADDSLFTVMVSNYDYAGGAHPSHGTRSINIDPVTGKVLQLKDVLKDTEAAPQAIKDELYAAYPELVEEFDSYIFYSEIIKEPVDQYKDMLKNDMFTWSLLKEGLRIYFSPYEVATYAAGYLEALLPYDKYPGLVQQAYIPTEDLDVDSFVTKTETEKEYFEPTEPSYGYEHEDEFGSGIEVENKTWSAFTEDGRGPDDGEHIKLTKINEEKTDWLDLSVWADKNGFEVARLPYSDDKYYYYGTDPVEYDYMYNRLEISDSQSNELLYNLNLRTLCNGPDQEQNKNSAVTQFIQWAKIYDGTLYVSIIHNGYSSEEPNSSYVVAIAPDTGYVLWRSKPLVANAGNFQIVKDTIICGYGFTAEDDYIYLLDRFTGQQMDAIKINSAASQFEVVGDTLYVATYNTAYQFNIE